MRRNYLIVAVVTSLIVLLSASSVAQTPAAQAPSEEAKLLSYAEVTALEEQARTALKQGDYQRALDINLDLHKQRPFVQAYMVEIVRAAALIDDKTMAYEHMLLMQRQGLAYDFNQTEDTLNIRNTQVYRHLNDLMVEALIPAGDASTQFILPGNPADYRSITWDNTRKKLLVGTAKEGKLLAVTMTGAAETLLEADDENGLWSINGLAVDTNNNRLWISSSPSPEFLQDESINPNQGALYEFNLESLELIGRYFLPIDRFVHDLGSVAVTNDGHVYVVDRGIPIVYVKTPESDRIEAFVSSKNLVAFTDLAVTPDNSRIFVSDVVKGIFVVDPKAQQAAMLSGPTDLNLGGIESIEYAQGNLFVIQSGIRPQRLMRLKLNGQGSVVESVSPMAIAIEEFNHPGVVTLKEDGLYYFANTKDEDSTAGSIVMRTALESGNTIVPPDMRQFQKTLEKKQKRVKKQQ